MTPVWLLSCAIFAPVLAGLAGLLLPRNWRGLRVALAVLGPAASLALLGGCLGRFGFDAGPLGAVWLPQFRMDFFLLPDRIGLFFALLVCGIGLLVTLYARAYFGPDDDSLYRFFPSLHLFMTAMIGLALADNFLLLLLFWELTSISSFLLIGWDREDEQAVRNAIQAFLITGAGGLCLMGGLLLLALQTGAWNFSDLFAAISARGLPANGATIAAFVLIFIGAATKSAQWPLHFWLPGAMAAPTPVSAYLHSATMVKAGVFLIGRLWVPLAALPLWPALILPVGAITMVLGSYVALRKSDLKQIFAYTTVSQLGLLMCMYGLAAFDYKGEPNLIWDLTQILNHALYKAPLFIIAGAIAHLAHTRELPELRGLIRHGGAATVSAVTLIVAAYAMAAGPFTLSFAAKEFFFYQIVHGWEATRSPWFYALGAAGVAVGALNVAIFVRLTRALVARPISSHAESHETGFWPAMLWFPGALIVALQLLGGIAPGFFDSVFGPIERSRLYFDALPSTIDLLLHPGVPLVMSLSSFVIGLALGFLPVFTTVVRDLHAELYPAFYNLVTRGGGWVFGRVQTGHLRTYLGVVCLALVLLVGWAMRFDLAPLARYEPVFEPVEQLLPGYLIACLIGLSAALMPAVTDRASRILMLGTVGFSVTGFYYLYNAPDLALTQISIEIVSLILFLLVLGLLPPTLRNAGRRVPRLALSVAVGAVMFWITLSSSTANRHPLPYLNSEGRPFAHLGEFFLRNADKGLDTQGLHEGGGGNNVVNVILVDFRGFDTLGEIIVLGLAGLGVWTLLRRRIHRRGSRAVRINLAEPRRRRVERSVPA